MRRNANPPDAPAEETRPGAPGSENAPQPPADDDHISDDGASNGSNRRRQPTANDNEVSNGSSDRRQPPPDDDATRNGSRDRRQPPPDDDRINDGNDDDHREPWYSWNRWKYIGGALFLVISAAGVSYVIWDTIDLLPRPVTIDTIRAALRVSPGRITDVVALAGLFSFGPPAGVDLMFGAKKAAEQWARTRQKKDWAAGHTEGRVEGRVEGHAEGRVEGRAEGRVEGRAEGHAEGRVEGRAEGRAEERKNMIAKLRARANGNPDLNRLLEELENDD